MPGPDLNTAQDALASLLAEIQAVPTKDVRISNVRATDAVSAAQKLVEQATKDRAAIEAPFKTSPFEQIRTLVPRALAFWAADKQTEGVAVEASDIPALYAEAGELKTVAVKVLDLIAGQDPAVGKVLDAIRPGTGYADRADDLTALHPLLLARKAAIVNMGVMTEAQVDRVGALAPKLLAEDYDQASVAAALLRNRAFTHFYAAWSEVERHLDFVFFHDPDARAGYPNLYPRRPSKKSSPEIPTL